MKLSFFVHECILEAGHTRAMLELIRALPPGRIDEIHLIYFEGSPSRELLPEFEGRIFHHRVPLNGLTPFLLKAIFFQIWSFFLIRFFLPKDCVKVGIGTACLNVDISNVQFVQGQWEPYYFKELSIFSLRYFYKKLLFLYFGLCENYLFRKEELKIIALSDFVRRFLQNKYQVPDERIETVHSSVNLDHFPLPSRSKVEIKDELLEDFSFLATLNLDKPIFLFVGAFERKGLYEAIAFLKADPNSQIIVVGKPEAGKSFNFKSPPKVFHIEFTKKLKLLYELSDVFIFPTKYEPFGLVIAEAAAMGNQVLTYRQNVGASEILGGLSSVKFLDQEKVNFSSLKIISLEEKVNNANKVRERLSQYSWSSAARKFSEILSSF